MVIMYVSLMFLLLIVVILMMMMMMNYNVMIINLKLFNVNFFGDFEILLSIWNIMFMLMVLLISFSVLVFSFSYMSSLFVNNFIFLYLSFIFSMVWLVLNNNFYWMMLGWDGLGVVSFLLIVFYMNIESINNGLFTLFQNRIGDVFFVLFILGVLDLSMWSGLVLYSGTLFLLIGSAVKSAQFPFNSWLLSAMSAPTPISSLVHSSTLVVAGVFILLQYCYCLMDVLNVLKYISLLSLMWSFFGLVNEADMKKLIAYSTMSHVSLMMFMLSLKLFKITYFHLNIHAMFKSLMFMCFGFVMLSSFHSQDKRLITLLNLNPLIKMIYYFSCLCLAGLPMLSAFFSKDLIIEKLIEFNTDFIDSFLLMVFLGVSIYYSMKLLRLVKLNFVLTMVEKNYIGMLSVFIMVSVMILMINIYLSLVFSITLEMMSFKFYIYVFVLCFFLLSIFSNLNYKLTSYDPIKNIKDIWAINFYAFDLYVYWNIFLFMQTIISVNSVKYILLMNWWVLIMMILFF